MREHYLYAKEVKFCFVINKVKYMGNFISVRGVETDAIKLNTIIRWPLSGCVKEFFGLMGYYRKFIKHYALISKTLIDKLIKISPVYLHL